jgi:hypothetical protein
VIHFETDKNSQAAIRKGICEELDRLKEQYAGIEDAMQAEVIKTIIPSISKLATSSSSGWITGARIRMTMVPSMGFFIVVPIVSCPQMLH